MPNRRRALVMLALASLACSGDNRGLVDPRGGPTEVSKTVTDATGDTFGTNGAQWDLTALTISRDAEGVTVVLNFTRDVISPGTGDPSALIGFVDLDLDQDPTTGGTAVADEFRQDGASTGLGVDRSVRLLAFDADGGVPMLDANGAVTGRVFPLFDGRRVTIRIPTSLLGNDDGFLNAAAIVGRSSSATDLVPERGHLALSP